MANQRIIFPIKVAAIKDSRYFNLPHLANSIQGFTSGALTVAATAAAYNNGSGHALSTWPSIGQFRIDDEVIQYSGIVANSGFTALNRGYAGTTAATHTSGTPIAFEGWYVVSGVQSLDIDTNFNVEQVFQFGQDEIYQNIENIPDVELTLNRVIDGTMPVWFMVTQLFSNALKGRVDTHKSDLALSIYPDTQTQASGTANRTVVCSGLYVSSLTYTFPVDGNFTEEVTLVGNDKTWTNNANQPSGTAMIITGNARNHAASGVQRRQNLNLALSELPSNIPGIPGVGRGNALSGISERLQTITISVDLGRDSLFELGRRKAFLQTLTIPIEVTTTIETITGEGDLLEANSNTENLTDSNIYIALDDGTIFDLGTRNRLVSTSQGGGDTGGGSETVSYTYTEFNVLAITNSRFDM